MEDKVLSVEYGHHSAEKNTHDGDDIRLCEDPCHVLSAPSRMKHAASTTAMRPFRKKVVRTLVSAGIMKI